MNNQLPPRARLGLARGLLELIVMIIYFFIILAITPIWLIIVLCGVEIGNPWRWLSARWKMANGDYEGAARMYEEDAQRLAEKYDLPDEDDEAEELRQEFISAVGEPDETNSASQLLGLAQKGYFSAPEYDFYEGIDENGDTEWECTISIDEYYFEFTYKARYKRYAQRMCAYEMYKEILNNPNDD